MLLVKCKEVTLQKSIYGGRRLARGAIVMLGLATSWVSTCAAQYPNRPLRLLVTLPPGGSGDFQARILSVRLTEKLGQQLVVDHRPGAAGIVATEIVIAFISVGAQSVKLTTARVGWIQHLQGYLRSHQCLSFHSWDDFF